MVAEDLDVLVVVLRSLIDVADSTATQEIEVPGNWQLAPGYPGTLLSIVEKTRGDSTGGLITLQHVRLEGPLDSEVLPEASKLLLREVQDRERTGRDFTSEVKKGHSAST